MYCISDSTFQDKSTKQPVFSAVSADDLTEITHLLQLILGSASLAKKLVDKVNADLLLSDFSFLRRLKLMIQNERELLTEKQAKKLTAALDLGLKLNQPGLKAGHLINEPELAAAAVYPYLSYQFVEKFAVLCLDTHHHLLAVKVISSGSDTETIAPLKHVFEAVILSGGRKCIIAHNHPSGNLTASPEDLTLTAAMIKAGKVLDIEVLDHLIIGQGENASLRATTFCFEKPI